MTIKLFKYMRQFC